jgi:hypothetical protein
MLANSDQIEDPSWLENGGSNDSNYVYEAQLLRDFRNLYRGVHMLCLCHYVAIGYCGYVRCPEEPCFTGMHITPDAALLGFFPQMG